jgi:cell envelope opacity-associated protein A
MTSTTKAPPLYPKSHILAASGVAALLSLALLVFPTREVEAKKTYISLELDSSSDYAEPQDDQASAASQKLSQEESPFATSNSPDDELEAATAGEPQAVDPLQHTIRVENGDTLSTVFTKVGLSANTLQEVLNSSKEAKQLTHLKVGQPLEFKLSADGQLEALHSKLSDLESISLLKADNGFSFKRELIKPEVKETYAHGVINSSLFVSAKRAGLSHNLTMDLANVFGYDIDFAMDIREGDEFEVIYEKKVVNGKQVGTGDILSARFTNRGKTYTAVRYTNKQGNSSYYNADG